MCIVYVYTCLLSVLCCLSCVRYNKQARGKRHNRCVSSLYSMYEYLYRHKMPEETSNKSLYSMYECMCRHKMPEETDYISLKRQSAGYPIH
jgi:hypothetical protein